MNLAVALTGGIQGSGAVGIITITASTGGQVFGKFLVNDTTCETGRYTVRKGHKFLGYSLFINGGKGCDATLKLEASPIGRLPLSVGEIFVSEGYYDFRNMPTIFLIEGETAKVRAFYNSGGSGVRNITGTISGQLATVQTWDSLKI